MKEINEDVVLKIPDVEKPEHGRSQGFYNPDMKTNRDISISIVHSYIKDIEKPKILDALTATGIRALRYKKYFPEAEVYATDVNENAIQLAKENCLQNSLDVTIEQKDARKIMYEQGFDVIDIDPYGSPVNFFDASFQSIGRKGLIAVTATDTAALNGVYPLVSKRRYGIKSKKCDFSKELSTRILLTSIIKHGFEHDKAFVPILCYQERHYIRIFGQVKRNVSLCNKLMKDIKDTEFGELYLGFIQDKDFLKDAIEFSEKNNLSGTTILYKALNEINQPFYYYIPSLNIQEKINKIIEKLNKKGFKASRTVFENQGIKTNAKKDEIEKLFL